MSRNSQSDLIDELESSQGRIDHLAALFLAIRGQVKPTSREYALADLGLYTADEWADIQHSYRKRLEAGK